MIYGYVVYEKGTGKIVQQGHSSLASLVADFGDHLTLSYLLTPLDGASHYVSLDDKQPVAKQPLEVMHSLSGLVLTLSNVPIGAVISCEGASATATEATFVLTFDVPGVYQVSVTCEPVYYPYELEVSVV